MIDIVFYFLSSCVLTAIFPGELRLAGSVEAKDDGSVGDNWSCKMCSSQIVTTNKPISNYLQAGCPSCRRTNNVNALKGFFLLFPFSVNFMCLFHYALCFFCGQKLDPTQFVRIYGRQAKIHVDSAVAMAAEGPQIMYVTNNSCILLAQLHS